jgi:hypothetical protein
MVAELNGQLDQAELSGRYAGVVLVFGVSDKDNMGVGSENARKLIESVLPKIDMFSSTATRDFWGSTGSGITDGGFKLDIYLLATPDHPPLTASETSNC